jgi:MerR family transcriptional regulator/heat shock protein HspR
MTATMPRSRKQVRDKFHKLTQSGPASAALESATDWEPVMAIGVAATMVGLSASALRKYESQGLLIYHRTPTGRRLLCRADIKRINMIQHLINQDGLNIEGIRRLLALLPCWDLRLCSPEDKSKCKAVLDALRPCWMVRESECLRRGYDCRQCEVYRYGAYCAVTMKMLVHGLSNGGD